MSSALLFPVASRRSGDVDLYYVTEASLTLCITSLIAIVSVLLRSLP